MHVIDAPGGLKGSAGPEGHPPASGVIIDNRTTLPDDAVREAVMAHWVENAAMQFGEPSTFQLYATGNGNVLNRSPFRTPGSVVDEIRLARSVADTDDDIQAVIGQMVNTAYRDGMQNQHEDEPTLALFNEMARNMNLDVALKEMYREYLISAQVNTLSLFSRTRLSFTPEGAQEPVERQVFSPMVGVLPSENIRVLSNDVFGTGELAYDVTNVKMKEWLEEFFATTTTAAKKDAMRRAEPIMAAIFTAPVEVDWNDTDLFTAGKTLYKLNPRMVHRTTMPKGSSAYPRPRMTSNFALLEAKRLLNIMDYSLLQGGTNYIVVAKQGSDKLPAQQPEIDNLTEQVRTASRTGVMVGDHRLTIEIITPDLEELLNPKKRTLIGRKLAMALMQVPEQVTPDPGNEGARSEMEFIGNTISADRHDIKRHIERFIYAEIVKRNRATLKKGAPTLWHQKIVLAGVKDFFDNVVKARDRGDIPRKWAVEVLGFDYEAGVSQRKRELDAGHDEIMTPGSVPFSNNDPSAPPNDNEDGRPPGSSPDNGRPGSRRVADPAQRPRRTIPRRRGEPIRAHWDGERTIRYGELTASVLEEYPEHSVGRVTETEREAIAANEVRQRGPVCTIPVNPEYTVREIRALRLTEGLSLLVGQRADGAIVARALSFREPEFDLERAEEMAMRWGFITASILEEWHQEGAAGEPVTAEAVATQIAATATQALQGFDLGAVVAAFQESLAKTVADAVAQAVKDLPAPVIQLPAGPPSGE